MKIRNGFVSNSSSCSFVVVGFEIAKDIDIFKKIYMDLFNGTEEEIEKQIDEWDQTPLEAVEELIFDNFNCNHSGYRILSGSDNGVGNKTIFCRVVVDGDDPLEDKKVPLTNIMKEIEVMQEKLGCNSEINIYTGTRCC